MKNLILFLFFIGLAALPDKVYSQKIQKKYNSELESVLKNQTSKELRKLNRNSLKKEKQKLNNDRKELKNIVQESDTGKSILEKIDEHNNGIFSDLDKKNLKVLIQKPGVVDLASRKINKRSFNREYLQLLNGNKFEEKVDTEYLSHLTKEYKEGIELLYKDSLSSDKSLKLTEEMLEEEVVKTEQVKKLQELVDESENSFDISSLKKDALLEEASTIKNLPSQLGKKHFEGKESELMAAVEQVQNLKKKYRYVPDSENLDSALKQNSLKDISFWKRIEWDGNFNVQWGRPFVMDFGPSLGYKFSKRFSSGMSGVARVIIRNRSGFNPNVNFSNVGYRLYTKFFVYHSFCVYGEYETIYGKYQLKEQIASHVQNYQSLNIGVGKQFNIVGGIKGKLLVLYNVPLKDHEYYRSPWIFRIGIGK